jgi:diacylglycerol kinase family enzyme
LENVDVVFGIIPAGSANGLATDLKYSKELEESFNCFQNASAEIDMIVINGRTSFTSVI